MTIVLDTKQFDFGSKERLWFTWYIWSRVVYLVHYDTLLQNAIAVLLQNASVIRKNIDFVTKCKSLLRSVTFIVKMHQYNSLFVNSYINNLKLSPSKKVNFICFNLSPLKDEKCFSLHVEIFTFLS